MLLDCWSIPCVIVLTWIFLETKYGLRKFIGVGVCVAGLILVVFSDVHASDRASKNIRTSSHQNILQLHVSFHKTTQKLFLSDSISIDLSLIRFPPKKIKSTTCIFIYSPSELLCFAEGPSPLKGDLLVILGSMLYACSNVTEVTGRKPLTPIHIAKLLVALARNNYVNTCFCFKVQFNHGQRYLPICITKISGVRDQEKQQDGVDGDVGAFRSSYQWHTNVSL
jgi:drug/metabolite transporter (DMT)-like permease